MESTTAVDMSQEIFRMASFGQNPPKPVTSFTDNVNTPLFPSIFRLSKAGFYRDPGSSGDEVRCFACGLILKDWSRYYGESPMSVHLCKSPNCPYVNCQNIDSSDVHTRDTTPCSKGSGSPQSQDVFLTAAESATVRRQLFPADENVNRNNCTTLTAGQIQASIQLPFRPKFGDSAMLFERNRYTTFGQYPCTKAKDLAASGFVVRSRGKVACVFCGKQTDCPTADCSTSVSELHRGLNPNCPFLRGFDLGNVSCALEDRINSENSTNTDNEDTGDNSDSVTPADVLPKSSLFFNPYFEDFTVRKESFRKWPPQMKPTSQQLTEAGFFYSGTFDMVTCFTCGISLSEWQIDADALIQHVKHSPSCLYLQKLPQYHEIKQLASETQEMTSCEMPVKDGPVTNESPVKLPFPFKPKVDPTILTNCQAALANSYPNYDLLVGWMLTTRKEFQLLQEMRGDIHVQEITLENKDKQIEHKDKQIEHKDKQIEHKDKQIEHKDKQIDQHRQQIEEDKEEIQHKDQEIQQFMQQVSDNEQYRDENLHLRQQLDHKQKLFDTHLNSKNQLLEANAERINQLEQDNIRMQNMIMQLRRELQVSTSRRG